MRRRHCTGLAILRRSGRESRTHARSNIKLMAENFEGSRHRAKNAPGNCLQIAHAADRLNQHRKFIATKPRGRVLRTQRADKSLCCRGQYRISGRMAQRVIDPFEAIEIEK